MAGRLTSDVDLQLASSGGLTSWTAQQLIRSGSVDGVIHVVARDGSASTGELFEYIVSEGDAFSAETRKSNYHLASIQTAISSVRGNGRRYAVIGVPCVLKGLRALCAQAPDLAAQLPFMLGLVCGHMKSAGFAESLAWQIGIAPDDLAEVDFRVKRPDAPANGYAFAATGQSGNRQQAPNSSLMGSNWGHGAFQLDACNFCDDIFAEVADISFGDAWLPQFAKDWRGTNLIVCRNSELDSLLMAGNEAGDIELFSLDVDAAKASQSGNFRHRRVGLAVRLADDIAASLSVPVKRVEPDRNAAEPRRRRLIRQRRALSAQSHELFAKAKTDADLRIYLDGMAPAVRRYRRIDEGGRGRRLARKVLRRIQLRKA